MAPSAVRARAGPGQKRTALSTPGLIIFCSMISPSAREGISRSALSASIFRRRSSHSCSQGSLAVLSQATSSSFTPWTFSSSEARFMVEGSRRQKRPTHWSTRSIRLAPGLFLDLLDAELLDHRRGVVEDLLRLVGVPVLDALELLGGAALHRPARGL